jgi:hypothetical protein
MNDTATHGHCLCEKIRMRIEGDPIWIGHCHCASCRRNTGSAVATFVAFRPAQVTYTRANRAFFNSSPGVRRGFCKDCGTPLTYEADKFPNETKLYLCTLDDADKFTPTFHVFYAEQVTWFDTADELVRYPRTTKRLACISHAMREEMTQTMRVDQIRSL